MQATAQDLETLDELCMRITGRTAGVVEATLAANPGIANNMHLYAGQVVQIVAPPFQTKRNTINLWD
jgi:phage tail protein X